MQKELDSPVQYPGSTGLGPSFIVRDPPGRIMPIQKKTL